jgi:hypothetical protein
MYGAFIKWDLGYKYAEIEVSNGLYYPKKFKALSKLPNAVWVEPSGIERRAVRLETCCSGGFQSALVLRNQKRAVGSAYIWSFQIFKVYSS